MATDWSNPSVNVLKSEDALALQQIFRSLANELARMNAEINTLKNSTNIKSIDISKLR